MSFIVVHAADYTLSEAQELFDARCYEQAAPVFEREVKKKPNNGTLNFRYAMCLYHMGDYSGAIKYFTKAASRKVHEAHYYLGEIYMQMYHFSDALAVYDEYETALDSDTVHPSLSQRISKARVGERMMRGVERVQVIDSINVDSLTFFTRYKLTPESGTIIEARELPSHIRPDTATVAYVPQRGDVVYFAAVNEHDNFDLYHSSRLLGNEWSEPLSLSDNVNNDNNQCYPFLLGDGQTLYFAQDGENSLGGYDLFITIFNSETGDFMLPQNLGMPFNSPYNDYMMAIDETLGVGWFVTDRNHIPGQLTIYTFIPNEVKSVYQDMEYQELVPLAQLSDISATWESDTTRYASLLEAINSINVQDTVSEQDEFYFVLRDDIVYTRASHFHNKQALNYYYQAHTLQRKLNARRERLQQLRQQYAIARPSEREQLVEQITKLEALIINETETPLTYENRARQAELSFLNINCE